MTDKPSPTPVPYIGMLVPGLGFLLAGRLVPAIGLFMIDTLLVWAAVMGFPRLMTVIWPPQMFGQMAIHGLVAFLAWPIFTAMVYYLAWRQAFPPAQTSEQRHSFSSTFQRQLGRNRTGMIGLMGVTVMAILTVLTPMIAPYDPDEPDTGGINVAPGRYEVVGVAIADIRPATTYSLTVAGEVVSFTSDDTPTAAEIASGLAAAAGLVPASRETYEADEKQGLVWFRAVRAFTPLSVTDVGPGLTRGDTQTQVFLFGTDGFGRDMFSRVLFGARISMLIGLIAVTISVTIGVVVGAIAGYVGGWLDRALMWVVELLLSLPSLVLLLALVGLFRVSGPKSVFLIVTILGLTGWTGTSRLVRSQILSLREQEFVQAARAMGYGPTRIVFKHLIPNALAPVIVQSSLAVGATMLAEASLSFLGLGVAPPTSTWGTLVADGRTEFMDAWWIFMFPGLFIAAAVMSFSLLGDGLRDTLDPRLRGR